MSDPLVPPADEFLDELISDLAEAWARVPADETGELVASAYVRAAYGRGYMRALLDG